MEVWCGLWTCCEEFDDPFGGINVGWAVVILVMQIQPRAQGEQVTQGLHYQNKRQSNTRPPPPKQQTNPRPTNPNLQSPQHNNPFSIF